MIFNLTGVSVVAYENDDNVVQEKTAAVQSASTHTEDTTEVYSTGNIGVNGDNVKYEICESGTIYFFGSGDMADFGYNEDDDYGNTGHDYGSGTDDENYDTDIEVYTDMDYGGYMAPFHADDTSPVTEKGNCGDNGNNVKYELHEDGIIYIYGTGNMYDYNNNSSPLKHNKIHCY